MKAALGFREAVQTLDGTPDLTKAAIDVYLYGSLSLTGAGHGTHKAVLGGLLGWTPDACDCNQLLSLLDSRDTGYERYALHFDKGAISFSAENIHFEGADPLLPYQNTLRFRLAVADEILL